MLCPTFYVRVVPYADIRRTGMLVQGLAETRRQFLR